MTHVPDSSSATPLHNSNVEDTKTDVNDTTLDNIPETAVNTTQLATQNTGEFVVSRQSSDAVHDHEVDEDLLKPLWFAKQIVKCPIALCTTLVILLLIITFVDSLVFELSDGSYRTFLVESDPYVIKYDEFTLATEAAAQSSKHQR